MLTSATGEELTSAHHATETYSHASDIFLGLSLRSWYEFCFTLSKKCFLLLVFLRIFWVSHLSQPFRQFPNLASLTGTLYPSIDALEFGQIHFVICVTKIVILAYTFCKLDKYILQDGKCGKIHFWFSKFGSLAGSLWPSIDALKLGNLGLDHNSFSRK